VGLFMTLGLTPATNSRLYERIPLRCRVTLLYFDSEHIKRYLPGRMRNVSGSGILVESLAPIKVGSVVYVRLRKMGLFSGIARVRHCDRRRWKYGIGLQYYIQLKNRF